MSRTYVAVIEEGGRWIAGGRRGDDPDRFLVFASRDSKELSREEMAERFTKIEDLADMLDEIALRVHVSEIV